MHLLVAPSTLSVWMTQRLVPSSMGRTFLYEAHAARLRNMTAIVMKFISLTPRLSSNFSCAFPFVEENGMRLNRRTKMAEYDVYYEATPNPQTMKFLVTGQIAEESVHFNSAAESGRS